MNNSGKIHYIFESLYEGTKYRKQTKKITFSTRPHPAIRLTSAGESTTKDIAFKLSRRRRSCKVFMDSAISESLGSLRASDGRGFVDRRRLSIR